MGEVIKYKKLAAKLDPWERSLPGVPKHDPTWMIGVLEDLLAFADFNCSIEIQQELRETTRELRRLVKLNGNSK